MMATPHALMRQVAGITVLKQTAVAMSQSPALAAKYRGFILVKHLREQAGRAYRELIAHWRKSSQKERAKSRKSLMQYALRNQIVLSALAEVMRSGKMPFEDWSAPDVAVPAENVSGPYPPPEILGTQKLKIAGRTQDGTDEAPQ